MLRPLNKNVLVKIKPKEVKGIIVPQQHDIPFEAVVLDKGSKVDLEIEIGDTLLLVPYCGSKISDKDAEHLIVTEKDIMGVMCGQENAPSD